MFRKTKTCKRLIGVVLSINMLLVNGTSYMVNATAIENNVSTYATVTNITSMAPTTSTSIQVGIDGGCGFTFPTFNGGAAKFDDVKADIALFVKQNNTWVSIDNNASSGWIYDKNYGNFWEGSGGYWFNPVEQTTAVKVASKSNPNVFIEYNLIVSTPVRNNYNLTSFDGKVVYTANNSGAIGLPLPKIDGGSPIKSEIDNFVYEIKVNNQWVSLQDSSLSKFVFSQNGYNNISAADQWGYWVDGIFGLWFQPIQKDMELRIGYPLDGKKGGNVGNNYVTYKFIGNPNAPRPDTSQLGDINLGTSDNANINGWQMVWNDEFNGTELDRTKWDYSTGYYLNDNPGTWGWGNNELQHYTDSKDNVFVKDGNLNIVALKDPKTFPQDPSRVAPYSSGKILSKDKYKFKYGRIDFSAKLPVGPGAWPALWLLPNDEVYGTWASSGEIDVMEARGRVPGESSGAIHFGDKWPDNTFLDGHQTFPNGGTINDGFHTYSLIWEPDMIRWYVDGKCFYSVSKEQWYSAAVPNNPYAPFDQEFYIIMNLAMGGAFDGGVEPTPDMFPSTMQVDYVRVYKEGITNPTVAVTGVTLDKSAVTLKGKGETTVVTANVMPVDATNKAVSYFSSNEAVATVAANGTITAVANGTTTITVRTADGNKTAQCIVTVNIPDEPVNVPVTGVTLNKTDIKLTSIGASDSLIATVMPSNATNKAITFTSSNEAVAKVAANGVVTAVAKGTATITVNTADGNKIAQCTVNVDIPTGTVEYGATYISSTTAKFFMNNIPWAILSYKINGGNQLNVHMGIDSNKNGYLNINNLKENDVVEYYITYGLVGGGQEQTKIQSYTHKVSTPSNSITIGAETKIEAENYTSMNGVQTEPCIEGTVNVGWLDAGDWMNYKVNVLEAGKYKVEYRVASENGGGVVSLEQGANKLGTVNIAATGGWQNWTTVAHEVNLVSGEQELAIKIPAGGFNINWIKFTKVKDGDIGGDGNTGGGTSILFEAENYSFMSGIQKENCSEGGQNVGYLDSGDWLSYNDIALAGPGQYKVQYRVASLNGGGVISLEQNAGKTVLGTINVPATGGWQNWQTVEHIVTITDTTNFAIGIPKGGYNINWIKFTKL